VSEGNLKIDFINSANYYSSIATAHKFRFIVIPGGVAASDGGRVTGDTLDRLRVMSYEDVIAKFNIPE
jgi:hypothetical protein